VAVVLVFKLGAGFAFALGCCGGLGGGFRRFGVYGSGQLQMGLSR